MQFPAEDLCDLNAPNKEASVLNWLRMRTHQTIMAPGKTFACCMVKLKEQ